jgi:hypothetical protein
MRDQYRVADELKKIVSNIREQWRSGDHFIRYAGQHRYERRDRGFGIYQRVKFFSDPPVSNAICSDLGDAARRSFRAGCLQIEYNKVGFQQPSLVEPILNKFDPVTNQTQTRVAFDEVLDQDARDGRVRAADVHYVIDYLDGGRASAEHAEHRYRLVYQQRVGNEVWVRRHS